MKHNAKRSISLLLAVLMCIGMLTGIVLPAAAETTEPAADPYAKVTGTDNNGVITPDANVYFVNTAWSTAPSVDENNQFEYTYGDGKTWGNGKTYLLTWGTNTFTSFREVQAAAKAHSALWAEDKDAYADELILVFAPGASTNATSPDSGVGAYSDMTPAATENVTQEDLITLTLLGPQAGKTPVVSDYKDSMAAAKKVNNNRNTGTETEFVFSSITYVFTHANSVWDGFAFKGGAKIFSANYPYLNAEFRNLFINGIKNPAVNVFLGIGGSERNSIIKFYDSYFGLTGANAKEAQQYLCGNLIEFKGNVFTGGTMSTEVTNKRPWEFKLYPTTPASASSDFYGDYATAPSIVFSDNTVAGWESCGLLLFELNQANFSGYTNNAVDIRIENNDFYDVGGYVATGTVIRTSNLTTAAMASSHQLTVTGNLFSFSKDWNTIKGTSEFNLIDFSSGGSGHALGGRDMTNWTIKDNTFIADYRGTKTHIVRNCSMSVDMSGNLFMDNDGNIMPFRGTVSGYGNNYGSAAAVQSDIYASDEFEGGIRELMVVKEVENGVACYSHVLLNERSSFAGIAGRVQGNVTMLLKRNDDGTPIEYDADTLLKFDNDKVKFEGIYSDKNCTKKVETVNQDNVTGKYAKATYTAGNTKLTVVYYLNTPTTYRIVDPTNAYVTSGYKFNGVTYKPGEKASDGVTATAAKRADGTTGFYEFINNSHKDASGAKVPSAYDGIPNPSDNYGSSGIEGMAMSTIVVLTPGTHYFNDTKDGGSQGMGKSVCYVGPQFGVSPFDKKLAETGNLANGRSFDPAKEAIVVGTFNPNDGFHSFVYDGIAFSGTTTPIIAKDKGTGSGSLLQTHVIKNCVFQNSNIRLMDFANDKTAGIIDRDILIADCAYDATGITHESKELILARAGKFTMRNFAVINDQISGNNRLVYSGLINPKYLRVNRLRTYADYENVVLYNSNRNIALWALRDAYTKDAGYDYYPNGVELNIKNCSAIGGKGYFFGAQSPQPKESGDDNFITLTATGNYFNRPAGGAVIQNYQDPGNEGVKCYTDDSVFANNEIYLPNGNSAFTCYVGQTNFSVDNNFYGTTPGSDRITVLNTATGSGYEKNSIYYLDPEMTKSVDISKFDLLNGDFESIKLVNYGSTGAFSASAGYNSSKVYDITKAFVANGGKVGTVTLTSGKGTLEGNTYTPADGDVLNVPVTVDDYTINWTVTLNNVWSRNGLAPTGDESYVDLTTQDLFKARTGSSGDGIFVAPDWSKFAYQDEACTIPMTEDTAKWETEIDDNQKEDTTANENDGNYIEMSKGTVFYAKMPTTGIVYKLTYGVTAANIYNADTSRAAFVIAFPGTYRGYTSYGASTLYYDKGGSNSNFGIGRPLSVDYAKIVFLGPQAGRSAADTVNGTANGRTMDDSVEAIFTKNFYIMNGIMGEGDELIFDGIAVSSGVFGTFQGENASNAVFENYNVTFTFRNVLADGYTGTPFGLYGPSIKHKDGVVKTNSVEDDITKNIGTLNMTVNIEDSFFNKSARKTGGLGTIGKMQVNQIHINNSVLLDTQSTTDQGLFYINPTTAAKNGNKFPLSYTCENSYLSLPYSYLFGIYTNGQDISSANRDGIEIVLRDNKLVNCCNTYNGTDSDRGSVVTTYHYTDAMAEMTDLIITGNTVTASAYPAKTAGGAIVSIAVNKPLNSVDISNNVFTGYGVKTTLNKGLSADVDIAENVFFDLDGNPVAPIVKKIGYSDVYLNEELTAKISDYDIVSGVDEYNKFVWAADGTNVYTQFEENAVAKIAYAEELTLDGIKAAIKFASDDVSIASLTGDVALGSNLTMVVTHAATGKSVTYKILLTGDFEDAVNLNDTEYADRDYYDPAVSGLVKGTPVVRNVLIDGVDTKVQFTVGENIFGKVAEIPVVNKQRDIYLFSIEYGNIDFGASGERNVMNYLHGANDGISGVVDTNTDGVPDTKNPARAGVTKETVINGTVTLSYHAETTVDGVTMGPKFRMTNTSGNWGADPVKGLPVTNMKLINSVSNSEDLLNTTNYIFSTGDNTHRINVIVENSEITLTEESIGKIFYVRNTNQLTLNNNVLDAGDAGDQSQDNTLMRVLQYHVCGFDNKAVLKTTNATDIDVDITNNLVRGNFLFQHLGNENDLPVDINIKDNRFENNNNTTTIQFDDLNACAPFNPESSIVLDGNTFNTLLDKSFGNYLWLSSTPDAEDFTMVLKNNTFIRTSKRGANYAIAYHGSYTVDASENNVFDGYMYNVGFHDYSFWRNVIRFTDYVKTTGKVPLLSNGDNHSTMIIDGKEYKANHLSETFTVADLFTANDKIDDEAKTVKAYANASAKYLALTPGEGMMAQIVIDGVTYYNAFPLTAGTATGTVQLSKINGELVGDPYELSVVVACTHADCYKDIEADMKVDPTCAVDGRADYTCPVNGDKFSVVLNKTNNHSYTVEVDGSRIPATCSATGSVTMKCATCDDTEEKTLEIDANAHKWGSDFTVDIPATCGKEGSMSIHCEYCTATKDVTAIPATGEHNYTVEVDGTRVDATCMTPGTVTMKCIGCDATEDQTLEINKENHTGNNTVVGAKDATCDEAGYTGDTVCECGTVITEGTEIPMKGHTEVVDAAVAPTCTETGLTEGKHCSVCNKVLVAQTVVDALGHTESEMIVVTPATPVSEGVGKIECTVCHIVLDDNIVIPVLDPTGEAYLNGVVYETVEAALADANKANDTVILLMNAEVEFLALDPDVTLDLNGNKLTAGYVIGFNGSAIIDTKDNGKLIIDKDKIALDLNNNGYLPVYDQDGYIFVSVNLVNRTALLNQKQYAFSPVFETEAHMPLMQGYENSGVKIVIRLTWEEEGNYRAKQDFIYLDELVTKVIDSYDSTLPNYKRAFSATFSGNEAGEAKDVKVSAVIISDTGVEIASVTTEFTA